VTPEINPAALAVIIRPRCAAWEHGADCAMPEHVVAA
jgi:hypothetical protein